LASRGQRELAAWLRWRIAQEGQLFSGPPDPDAIPGTPAPPWEFINGVKQKLIDSFNPPIINQSSFLPESEAMADLFGTSSNPILVPIGGDCSTMDPLDPVRLTGLQ
jgi:hypothetical protein